MEVQFVDRVLACSDCHGEFVFTAGEQLFFHDKQFKNDPKRCKPCKSRRSGLSAVANGLGPVAAGISRTETRTECSECSVQTTVPFKPTQGRPVLCRQCFQSRNRAAIPASVPMLTEQLPVATVAESAHSAYEMPMAAAGATSIPAAVYATTPPNPETVTVLTEMSVNANGATLSIEAAVLAAASMASASPSSSVASAADLASIAQMEETTASTMLKRPEIPTELLAAAVPDTAPADMVAATVETAKN